MHSWCLIQCSVSCPWMHVMLKYLHSCRRRAGIRASMTTQSACSIWPPLRTHSVHTASILECVSTHCVSIFIPSYCKPPQVHRDITSGNVLLTANTSGGGGRAGGRAGRLRAMARSCTDMQGLQGLVLMLQLRLMPKADDQLFRIITRAGGERDAIRAADLPHTGPCSEQQLHGMKHAGQ